MLLKRRARSPSSPGTFLAQAHAQVTLGDSVGGRHDVGERRTQAAEGQPTQQEGNQHESQRHATDRNQEADAWPFRVWQVDDEIGDDANGSQEKDRDAAENDCKAPEDETTVAPPVWPEMTGMRCCQL